MKIFQLFLVFSLVVFAGCAYGGGKGQGVSGGLTKDALIGQTFVLATVDGTPLVLKEYKAPTLAFDKDFRASGSVCNVFNGAVTLERDILKAGPMISTRMFCTEPPLNDVEFLFFTMMEQGAEVRLEGSTLTLRQGGHTLEYRQADK